RCDIAVVRQRVLRVRDGGGAHQPGQPARDPADPHRGHQRGGAEPGQHRQGAGPRHGGRRRGRHDALHVAAAKDREVAAMTRAITRWTVLVVIGLYLLLPLLAMVEFSTRGAGSTRTLEAWRAIGTDADLVSAIVVSLELALLTVAGMLLLLVPTM